MVAYVAAIGRLRFASDGAGIRTLVCMHGCPLDCKYCINKFTHDGSFSGTLYSIEELYEKVKVDNVYFRATGGGITFGGGEPLMQAEFISEFIRFTKKNKWNYVIETSLAVPKEKLIALAGEISDRETGLIFHVDIKTLDSDTYRDYTGKSLTEAKENLMLLLDMVKSKDSVIVRVPEILGFADKEMQKRTIDELQKMGVEYIDAFRYLTDV